MRIAIASGKGGTGKTTVAVNLAAFMARRGGRICYVDCDVEEPNGHIFIKPQINSSDPVNIPVPQVDKSKCTYCRQCAEICQFNAIACIPGNIMVFPELCHGCGGCTLVCQPGAISEAGREIGVVEQGSRDGLKFIQGRLHVGQALSPPLIRAVKERTKVDGIYIFDAPPGTSCPVIEAVRNADFTVLVTEPTPFGLNDLQLAVAMLRELGQPFAIVINRDGMGDEEVENYCNREKIDVLVKIPDDRAVAEAYSRGETAVEAFPEYAEYMNTIYTKIYSKDA